MSARRRFALVAPPEVVQGAIAWRVEALRDNVLGRPNPHLRCDLAAALPAWRADVREYLRALLERGVDLREVCA